MFFSGLLQVGFTPMVTHSCVASLPTIQVRKSCQNWKARNLRKSFLSRLVSMSRLSCLSSRKSWSTVLPTSQVVVLSRMSHVCLQMTWLQRLRKARFQCFRFSKLLKNTVKSSMKKCLKSSIWVWDSCWQ